MAKLFRYAALALAAVGIANAQVEYDETLPCAPGTQRQPGSTTGACVKPRGTIDGFAFQDKNNNGIRDNGEPGVPNVIISIKMTGSTRAVRVRTNKNGRYTVRNVTPGQYALTVDAASSPAGLKPEKPSAQLAIAPFTVTKYDFCFIPANVPAPTTVVPTTSTPAPVPTTTTVTLSPTPAPTTPVPEPAKANIGPANVFSDTNNNGVQDAGEPGLPNVVVRVTDQTGKVVANTTTNAQGTYSFTNLPAGTYTVSVDLTTVPAGYVSERKDGKFTVYLAPGQTFTEATFCFKPPATGGVSSSIVFVDYNGNKVQDAGEPGVPGLVIYLVDATDRPVQSTKTDANGAYSFANVPAGTYVVQVDPTTVPPGLSVSNPAGTVTVPAGGNAAPVNIPAVPKYATVGPSPAFADTNNNGVQDAGEPGLPNIVINLIDSTGKIVKTTNTDANGMYTFSNIIPGTYTVKVDPATVPAGYTSERKDGQFTVNLAPGQTFGGADASFCFKLSFGTIGPANVFVDTNGNDVQDAGEAGTPGVVVELVDSTGKVVQVTTTDANGSYKFDKVPAGTYTVRIDAKTIPANTTPNRSQFRVVLAAGQTFAGEKASFCLKPRPTASIKGAVTNNGAPLANVTVTVTDSTGKPVAPLKTDATGAYSVANLPAGTYTVTVDAATLPAGVASADANGGKATATVNWGEVATVNFTYRASFATVGPANVFVDTNGNDVQDAGEPGVAGVVVELIDQTGKVVKVTTTDANGSYKFENIVPGTYTVRIDTKTIPANTTPNRSQFNVVLQPGQVFAGEKASFCLKPRPTASIKGAVTNNGAPLANVTVTVTDSTGKPVAPLKTDATGAYSVANLPAGTYTVSVDAATLPAGVASADANGGKATVSVNWGEVATVNFAYRASYATIGPNVAFVDMNGNDIYDAGDRLLPGIVVQLIDSTGKVVKSTTTGADGKYTFQNIVPGMYTVKVDPASIPAGLKVKRTNGQYTVNLQPGQVFTDGDFCFNVWGGSISSVVFADANGNGAQDAGDAGIANVVVSLVDGANNVVGKSTTNANGQYSFLNVAPGTYTVKVDVATVPVGLVSVRPGAQAPATVNNGENVTGPAFGFNKPAPCTLKGRVWHDDESDGIFEYGDYGLQTTVTLYDATGTNIIFTTTTDARGYYQFANVPQGNYIIRVTPPAGHVAGMVAPNGGKNGEAPVSCTAGATKDNLDFSFVIPQPGYPRRSVGCPEGLIMNPRTGACITA